MKSCTPMQANMNCSSVVTIMMLPMVRMATKTHCTTCWGMEGWGQCDTGFGDTRIWGRCDIGCWGHQDMGTV